MRRICVQTAFEKEKVTRLSGIALNKGADASATEGAEIHGDAGGLDGATLGIAKRATAYPALSGGISCCSSMDNLRRSSVKLGTIHRRLAWPLGKQIEKSTLVESCCPPTSTMSRRFWRTHSDSGVGAGAATTQATYG